MMRNKYLIFVLSLFLLSFFSSQVSATPPNPPCYDVENPEHYKNLVFDSEIYSYFQDWQLKNITVLCHYYERPINVVLDYYVPQSYSPNNLNYETTIVFSFQDDQLVNYPAAETAGRLKGNVINPKHPHPNRSAELTPKPSLSRGRGLIKKEMRQRPHGVKLINANELNQVFGNYRKHIQNFENLEATKFFIKTTGATNVKHKQQYLFELESKPREYLNYNFIDEEIDGLSFANLLLINELSLFIPKSSSVSQIDEFKNHVGINYVRFQNNRLSIHEAFSCPICESYFTYDFDQLFSTAYSLDNNYEWKTFPEVQQAHAIIKQNLLINELSNCTIATGDMRTSTTGRYLNFPSGPCFMGVALKCDGGTRWKVASIRLNPDGTYDRLEIRNGLPFKDKTKR